MRRDMGYRWNDTSTETPKYSRENPAPLCQTQIPQNNPDLKDKYIVIIIIVIITIIFVIIIIIDSRKQVKTHTHTHTHTVLLLLRAGSNSIKKLHIQKRHNFPTVRYKSHAELDG